MTDTGCSSLTGRSHLRTEVPGARSRPRLGGQPPLRGHPGATRFLGVDAHDREILSYIPGSPVLPPYPDWALSEDALVSVAQLLHAYHRAVADFDPAGYTWPTTPPPPLAGELVSHNDPNLDNIIFRDGRAVALIDFDLASPGSRLWDVACAARLWAPLRPTAYIIDE